MLALLLLAGGLALGAIVWQTSSRTAGGSASGNHDAAACVAEARAFTGYPLLFAGNSVLGYPLLGCQHSRTETRFVDETRAAGPGGDDYGYATCTIPEGRENCPVPGARIAHPGGDAYHFVYGTCTIPEGRESCAPPIGITIDPCALSINGRLIPAGPPDPSIPVRSMTVRGAQADVNEYGISFKQSPKIISIGAPGGSVDERTANAVAIAEALIPANALAAALPPDALLTAALGAMTVACP
jgi:hypothetical protein